MTEDSPHHRTRGIEIPERTADAIAARLPMTEFESVDEYVTFALDRLLRELEREHPRGQDSDRQLEKPPASHEESTVEDRLESLGYL